MNERIKQIRRELGLTQTEFAERIGLKQNSIALIESGKRNISDQAVLSICREYGINEEWLRTGSGEKIAADSNDELAALATRYNLSKSDQVFIEKYVSLKPGSRDVIMEFILDVALALSETETHSVAESSPDLDVDMEVEEYRRQLELQKKAAAGSSASCTTNENEGTKKEA